MHAVARPPGDLRGTTSRAKSSGPNGEPSDFSDTLVSLAISPDGKRLAEGRNNGREDSVNIWLLELSRGGTGTRFTFGSPRDTHAVWSPDGSSIIFRSNRRGPYNLYPKAVNGVKGEEVLLEPSEDKDPTSWLFDGTLLLYTAVNQRTKSDIWVLPLEGERKPIPFLITEFNERQARFSPDGHWVAYTSDESGRDEIYVQSFSMKSGGTTVFGGKWHISVGSGVEPAGALTAGNSTTVLFRMEADGHRNCDDTDLSGGNASAARRTRALYPGLARSRRLVGFRPGR